LGDEMETFNYVPLVKLIPSDGITRIFEDEDSEDSYIFIRRRRLRM
jgi:hypothetical protein